MTQVLVCKSAAIQLIFYASGKSHLLHVAYCEKEMVPCLTDDGFPPTQGDSMIKRSIFSIDFNTCKNVGNLLNHVMSCGCGLIEGNKSDYEEAKAGSDAASVLIQPARGSALKPSDYLLNITYFNHKLSPPKSTHDTCYTLQDVNCLAKQRLSIWSVLQMVADFIFR